MKKLLILITLLTGIGSVAQADIIYLSCDLDSGNSALMYVDDRYDSDYPGHIMVYEHQDLDKKLWHTTLDKLEIGYSKFYIGFDSRHDEFAMELDRTNGRLDMWETKYRNGRDNMYDGGDCKVIKTESVSNKF